MKDSASAVWVDKGRGSQKSGGGRCLPSSRWPLQLTAHPHSNAPCGDQDEKVQDAGPRELRCTSKE